MSLQIGKERAADFGPFLCLIAEAEEADTPSEASSRSTAAGASTPADFSLVSPASSNGAGPVPRAAASVLKTATGPGELWDGDRVDLGPLVDFIVATFFPPEMRQNYAATYRVAGVKGAVVIDAHGEHVPRKKRRMPNGTIREVRRTKIAYLSNLAVAPCARRAGIGRRLLQEAERAAAGWGCRSIALHVDPSNDAALQMYRSVGYRAVSEQPAWQRVLEGRQKPLLLMMRTLPRAAPQADPSASERRPPAAAPGVLVQPASQEPGPPFGGAPA